MELVKKVKGVASDVKLYWKQPTPGRYMPFKEIASYSVGGMGWQAICMVANALAISGTNIIMSNATGISPTKMLIIYYITAICGIPFTAIRANMVDNIRAKGGKYRPYLLTMGIPTAILAVAIVYTPYKSFTSTAALYLVVTLFSLGMQFVYTFYNEAYDNLLFVLSPNTQERSDVSSIKSIISSFAPTVINPLIPFVQGILKLEDINDIRLYRVLYPPVVIFGILMSILVFVNTKEKIVQARTHIVKVKFWDALRTVAKNKYFWIISLAGWIGFLESAQGYVLGWLYNYGKLCTPNQYGIITIIYGNASLWGMLAAPFAIRRWGKKNVLIVTNLFNILFLALMYPAVGANPAYAIWLVLACLWMNAVMGSFSHILTPSINADMRDYQHYISGERIDGMFGAIGLIGTFIGLATSTVWPFLFERFNIYEGNGYENAYDILMYEPNTLYSIVYALIILSVIGAALNVIPYFFYDLTETKQKAMVRILKIRAMFEDYGNNSLKDDSLVEAIDIVRETRKYVDCEKVDIPSGKGNRKAAKQAREHNEAIEVAGIVNAELTKYSTDEMQYKLKRANEIYALGIENCAKYNKGTLKAAKAMPKSTDYEKEIRKEEIRIAKRMRTSAKLYNKHYKNGLVVFDNSVIEDIFAQQDKVDLERENAYSELYAAKAVKDKATIKQARARIKQTSDERYIVKGRLKKAVTDSTLFKRTVEPYSQAEKLIAQSVDYTKFDDIELLYDAALERTIAAAAQAKALDEKLASEKKAHKEQLKAEKAAKRGKK